MVDNGQVLGHFRMRPAFVLTKKLSILPGKASQYVLDLFSAVHLGHHENKPRWDNRGLGH